MHDQKTNEPDNHPISRRNWIDRVATPKGMLLIALLSVIMILVAMAGGWYLLKLSTFASGRTVDIEPPESIDDLIETYPELAPILANSELDSVYKEFFVVYHEDGADAAIELARKRGMLNENNEIRMTLELDTEESDNLVAGLEERGIKVTAASGNVIDIAIPLNVIAAAIQAGDPGSLFQGLSGLEHIVRIRLPRIGLQDVGSMEIESLEEIGVSFWHDQNYLGEGIRIGILDMGFNGYQDLLGSDLPESVVARSFIYGHEIDDTDTTHGTACAEVIHDVAPAAELVFAAYETDAEQRQAVEWLLTQDVDIISHSAGSIYGPMDGTGAEARMVNRIVDGGVVWINSAGNSGDTHYRGVYTDANGNDFHDFTPGDELMGFIPDGFVVMVLNWDDWGNGEQDFDLYVLDEDQNEIAMSENIQEYPGDDAAEIIRYYFSDSGPYYIVFYARNVTRPVTLDFFIYDSELEYFTADHSITTPADAENAITVGATFWRDDTIEFYSSRGPTHDGRLKPNLSAPAGVSVSVNDQPFFGTSASAPHVAGAAALVLEAYPDFTPADVMSYLQTQAIDLGDPGPDYDFGYGRLWLGDVPVEIDVQPEATNTSTPTPTQDVQVGLPVLPAVTPTTQRQAIETPEPISSGVGSTEVLLICACVAIPALLGLGGVVLLVGIWMYRRSRKSTPRAAVPARPPVAAPQGVSEPDQAEKPLKASVNQHVCPRCQSPHRPQARFCNVCGQSLQPEAPLVDTPIYCQQCGSVLRPSAKFCPVCGHKR